MLFVPQLPRANALLVGKTIASFAPGQRHWRVNQQQTTATLAPFRSRATRTTFLLPMQTPPMLRVARPAPITSSCQTTLVVGYVLCCGRCADHAAGPSDITIHYTLYALVRIASLGSTLGAIPTGPGAELESYANAPAQATRTVERIKLLLLASPLLLVPFNSVPVDS